MIQLDEFRAGQVLTVRAMNALLTEVERLGKINASPPLSCVDSQGGLAFALDQREIWWIQLTSGGTGGKYAWTRKIADTSGTWSAHPDGRTGTTSADPAYEINANATVDISTTPIVPAWRDPATNDLRFLAGSC